MLALRLAQATSRPAPVMSEALQRPPDFPLIRMRRFARERRLDQCPPGRVSQLIGEWTGKWLHFAVQCKPEVLDGSHDHQPLTTPLPLKHHLWPAAARVPADGALRDLRSLDTGARHAETIGEIPERSGNRAPAPTDRAQTDARFTAVPRLLADRQIKRHDLCPKVSYKVQRFPSAIRQLPWQQELQLALDP